MAERNLWDVLSRKLWARHSILSADVMGNPEELMLEDAFRTALKEGVYAALYDKGLRTEVSVAIERGAPECQPG